MKKCVNRLSNFKDLQNVIRDKWHDVDIGQPESEKPHSSGENVVLGLAGKNLIDIYFYRNISFSQNVNKTCYTRYTPRPAGLLAVVRMSVRLSVCSTLALQHNDAIYDGIWPRNFHCQLRVTTVKDSIFRIHKGNKKLSYRLENKALAWFHHYLCNFIISSKSYYQAEHLLFSV